MLNLSISTIKKIIALFCLIVFLIVVSSLKISSTTLYFFIVEYVFFGILGIILFLFNRPNNEEYSELKYIKIFDIIFFILFTFVIIILNNSLYTKNIQYYILISIMFSIIGLKIIRTPIFSKRQKIITLLEIMMVGLIIRSSSAIINPYLFGADAYWHFNTISKIISNGFLDPLAGHYYYYPIAQIISVIWSIITNLLYSSFNAASISVNTIAILLIYLIGKETIGEREGLMGSLLLSISVFHIFGSIQFSPQRLGVTFLLLSLYAVVKIRSNRRYWLLFWVSTFATLLVHPVTAIVLAFGLGSYFIIIKVLGKKTRFTPSPFLSYLIMLVGYLVFVNLMLFTTVIRSIFFPEHGESLVTVALVTVADISVKPTYVFYFELIAGYFGPSVILFSGLLGGLILVQRKNIKIIPIFLLIILLTLIPVGSILGNSFGFQPGRLLSFTDVFLTILAGFGMIYLLSSIKIRKINNLVIFVLLLMFSFFSITSYLIEDDNTIFIKEVISQPVHVTESTLATSGFLMKTQEKNTLFMDYATSRYISNPERGLSGLTRKNISMFTSDFNNNGYYLLNMHYLPYGTYTTGGSMKLNEDIIYREHMKNKIYENNMVDVFLK